MIAIVTKEKILQLFDEWREELLWNLNIEPFDFDCYFDSYDDDLNTFQVDLLNNKIWQL